MRVVRLLAELPDAVAQASAEAASAFGDPTVFCEPYVERGRHIEVQVWGDHDGANVSVLGARDCSIQRRHQKVVEEAPPPGISEATLAAMSESARAAAHAIGYVGVGTVEFLYDPVSDRFWFLEMNTRLQVEHPVTECVTGLDLVALQLRAVEDPGLVHVDTAGPHGHAVEVRLYAEDPARDYQPQSGRLTRFEIPDVEAKFAGLREHGIRVDAGFGAGDEVGTHYDAMLAKVVCWAPTREQALRRLADVLRRSRIHGVRTNRDLLVALLRHPTVVAGEMTTTMLDEAEPGELADGVDAHAVDLSAFAAAVALAERTRAARTEQRAIPAGWRNVPSQPQTTTFEHAGDRVSVGWYGGRLGYTTADLPGVCVRVAQPARVVLEEGAVARTFEVFVDGDQVDVESSLGHVALRRLPRFVDPAEQVATGSLLSPMPGSVVSVSVAAGAKVAAGETVLVLEAMKMQHTVSAPHDGVVSELSVNLGDQVPSGAVLAVVLAVEEAEPEGDPT
jgi:propionyl-CoA carboxylase alpha chain